MKKVVLLAMIIVSARYANSQIGYVKINDGQFVLNNASYKYIGTNLWYGMHLGADSLGNRERLSEELDQLKELGLKNLRIMAASQGDGTNPYQNYPCLQTAPGVYNEDVFAGLDYLLDEMSKREMKAVVCLGNFWMWSGGFPQYVSWAEGTKMVLPDIPGGGSWDSFIEYAMSFYRSKDAQRMYWSHVETVLNRINTISGVKYAEDETIMSWQLANEPRAYGDPKGYLAWVNKSARMIKKLDKNHMVCIGSEGNTSSNYAGIDLLRDNQSKHIDYATTHVWIQNWGWFDPKNPETFSTSLKNAKEYLDSQLALANQLQKPLVIEEFGVSRDNGEFEPEASSVYRDKFFQFMFDYITENVSQSGAIQGGNFWSWGGQGRPAHAGGFWQMGDPLIGDPAHELQGWYSVYHDDESTLQLIKKYTLKIHQE